MKKMKIFKITIVMILILGMFTRAGNIITINNNPPVSYIDNNLSLRINSTLSVLEMKESVNSFLEFPSITFGSYNQTSSLFTKTPIEWIILEKRGNVAILMSKYVIDQFQYNNNTMPTVWGNSYIKTWLNSAFFQNSFTNIEKSSILQNNNDFLGTVYLLNINEAGYYFVDSKRRDFSSTTTTQYASIKPSSNDAEKFGYWLRNENENISQSSSKVLFNGITDAIDCDAVNTFGIRPVINVIFDPSVSPYSPTPIIPTPAPTPTPIPFTPEPIIDRSELYDGKVFKNGENKKNFTVSYYSDRVNNISGRISIKVYLSIPRIGSNNYLKASAINDLLSFYAYNQLRSYISDYVENNNIIHSPLRIRAGQIERDQGEVVEIPFITERNNQICRLIIDLVSNTCSLEED